MTNKPIFLEKSKRKIEAIYLHCTATKPGRFVSVDAIRTYHMTARGFSDIGYHYIIEPDGSIFLGRPVDKGGAHVYQDNAHTIGVSMVGNWDEQMVDIESIQIKQTGLLLVSLCELYEIKPASYGLLLHREAHLYRDAPDPRKSCPGVNINGRSMRLYVQKIFDKLEVTP